MEILCKYCKSAFVPRRTDARYCSHSCRQLAYVLRKALETYNRPTDELPYEPSTQNRERDNYRSLRNEMIGHPSNKQKNELTLKIQKPSKLTHLEANHTAMNDHDKENKRLLFVNTRQEVSTHQLPKDDLQNHHRSSHSVYVEQESPFIRELMESFQQRGYSEELRQLVYDPSVAWISLRYKCLLECILLFSEMQWINVEDLKEVCNAFTFIIQSRFYIQLSENYPYTNEIIELRDNIKNFCLGAGENEFLKFRLNRETKIKLLLARWELSGHVPKRNFNQLNFKE